MWDNSFCLAWRFHQINLASLILLIVQSWYKLMHFFFFASIKRDKRRDTISFGDSQNMVVGFTSTYAFRAYHHQRCEFESRSWRIVLDTTLYDKVCQWLAAGRLFSPIIKSDRHNATEILLKVASTRTLTL